MAQDLSKIRGRRTGGEPPAGEAGYFVTCPRCGQVYDKRDLVAVLHHDEPEHEALLPRPRGQQ